MMYIDTNVFIYAIENHPKYGKKCKKIFEDIEAGKIKVCASMLVLVEIVNVLAKINRLLKKGGRKPADAKEIVNAVLSLDIVWFDLDFFSIEKASEYSYDVNGADYVHLAAMETNSINEIISADKEWDSIGFVKRTDPMAYRS